MSERIVEALNELRAELIDHLEMVGDNGASMIRASVLRKWIAILDEAIWGHG